MLVSLPFARSPTPRVFMLGEGLVSPFHSLLGHATPGPGRRERRCRMSLLASRGVPFDLTRIAYPHRVGLCHWRRHPPGSVAPDPGSAASKCVHRYREVAK